MKKLLVEILLGALILIIPQSVFARSGCCSSHGGVCGCGCCDGSSLSSTCAPYYPWCNSPTTIIYTPTPTPTPINFPITISSDFNENTCKYSITASWEKPYNYDRFSISAVQTQSNKCIDPGPNPDTNQNSFNFNNLSSGRYLINVKPANQYAWDWYSYCQSYELPTIKPRINLYETTEDNKKYIEYKSTCAKNVKFQNEGRFLDGLNGKLVISPKEKTKYEFTASSIDNETFSTSIEISPITPSPTSTLTPTPSQIIQATNNVPVYKEPGLLTFIKVLLLSIMKIK